MREKISARGWTGIHSFRKSTKDLLTAKFLEYQTMGYKDE